ncbi:efflux RND transporter periplasmic adaptor subunit [Anaerobaca lacustris]|uniref:Efflux RND transporter periplasmic adaptor subunit n=1 Tax=Anaerobaca lacustris TaxID=3044600 RepID=A0AAW6U075_9BACT|nr:efflux RND transporter periplasmic adaptor subunit [Sedimentisphaerales bacterium M17dextr]
MTTPRDSETKTDATPRRRLPRILGGGIKVALTLLLVGGAMAAYKYQMETSPRVQRQRPARQARLVQVIELQNSHHATAVSAMGTVVPAQRVTLHPQVSGQIVEVCEALIPGGIVSAGDKLVMIDPRDYEVQVQQRRGDVARALKELKVEQGNQAIARQEYELLGEIIAEEDRELVLREPQLASARSALESAEAALRKAELDLARCEIFAPFNAVIQDKHVDLGTTVSAGTQLVTLIATDETWIDLKVPISQLQWLTIPQRNGDAGSRVKIFNTLAWGPERFRTGQVVRLYGQIEAEGRMARLLVAVDDPFSLKPANRGEPRLLMGTFVQAEIEGRTLESVIPIARPYVRDNDTVWIMDDNDQLEIRPVQIVYRGPEVVFVEAGLEPNERLITTDIAAPVAGMPLRLVGSDVSQGTVVAQEGETQP